VETSKAVVTAKSGGRLSGTVARQAGKVTPLLNRKMILFFP
jgi:hypothetical protein